MGYGVTLRESVKQHGIDNTLAIMTEALEKKRVTWNDLSLREMATSFLGDDYYLKMRQASGIAAGRAAMFGEDIPLKEAYGSVDVSNFAAIQGQLLVNTAKEKYQLAVDTTSDMFSIETITNGVLTSEIEPGLSYVKPQKAGENIQPGQPYPHTTFGPQYIVKPAPEKFGQIVNIQIEHYYADRTRQIQQSAESVGTITGKEEQYRKLRVALGLINTHNWNGTTYNTYLSSGAWANLVNNFVLTDWNSLDQLEQLFANMVDPYTGLPIEVDGKDILVTHSNKYKARRILNATEIRSATNPSAGTVDNTTISSNVLDPGYNLRVSKDARKALVDGFSGAPLTFTTTQANTVVLLGDFKKAFGWRQVWPTTITQAPPLNTAEFDQDIIMRIKGSGFGAAFVRDPRYVIFAYNA